MPQTSSLFVRAVREGNPAGTAARPPDPALRRVLEELADALQMAVMLSARLYEEEPDPAPEFLDLHAALERAAAALKRLR